MDQSFSVDSIGATRTRYRYAAAGRYTGQPSLVMQPQLCEECIKNQAAKIQELNSFEPCRECDFQSELDVHKQRLDERYKLCQSCHEIVNCHLKAQAVDLKTFLLRSHLQQSKSTPTKLLKRSSSPESISFVLAQLTCVLLASMLVCSESLSSDHHACGETLRFWSSSCAFFSNLSAANATSSAKYLALHFSSSIRVLMSTSLESGVQLLICMSSLTKRHYLHVILVCLLLNIITFLKRKTRFGILILLAWTTLSLLRCREVFWLKADSRWRFTGTVLCWFLSTSSFLFSLLSHSRFLRVKKKRTRYQFTPSQSSPGNHSASVDSAIMESFSESESSSNKMATELDYNLNGLSLGLPTKRRNGFNLHSSPENSGKTGSFWSQSVSSNSKETPLVSMHQRPLIVPATLHFSGLRERFSANHTQGAASVRRSLGMTSYAISSDDDTLSDSMDEEHSGQNSRRRCVDKSTKPEKAPREVKRSPSSCKARTTRFLNARTLLLFGSLLLNLYFIVLFSEWPERILRSLLKIFKRSKYFP